MTDAAAWAGVARWLADCKIPLTELQLRIPQGATAYVMKGQISGNKRRVYVKLEFLIMTGSECVCGRSFHLEDPR